jgi:uncharacterized lipoprotein
MRGAEMKRKTAVLAALTVFALSGCSLSMGSEKEYDPIGIETEEDALKRSPCACLDVPQIQNLDLLNTIQDPALFEVAA